MSVDQGADLLEGRSPPFCRVLGERNMVEVDPVALGDTAQIFVVSDDGADFCGEFPPARGAAKEVMQAVTFLAHEQHDLLGCAGVVKSPLGFRTDLGRNSFEPFTKLVDAHAHRRCTDRLTREEPSGVGIGVVCGLHDPSTDVGEKGRDACDDARGVGAAEGQNIATIIDRWCSGHAA